VAKNITLHTQRVVQNSQEFLIGVFTISQVLKFTRYTEYTILGFDKDNRPITKDEVQRKLNSSKVNQIVNFLLHDPMAIFPTNLVVSIPNHVIKEQIEVDSTERSVDIVLDELVFNEIEKLDKANNGDIYLSIIDGQHRIRGIEKTIHYLKEEMRLCTEMIRSSKETEKYESKYKEFQTKLESIENIELPVTFFIDPVLEYQAMIFSTINRTQSRVSTDLVYSLFGLTKKDSPQKSILNIVNALNGSEYSPFFKRVRLAGSGTKEARAFYKSGNPVLSQSTVVRAILKFICKDHQEEENARHWDRKHFIKNPNRELPFRKYYGQDSDDRILLILDSFFTAVSETFVDSNGTSLWEFEEQNTRKPKNILQSTIGFLAMLEILKECLKHTQEADNDKIDTYKNILSKAKSVDLEDNNEPKKYPFASSTKNIIINDVGKAIWDEEFSLRKV
jgi:DGQHR domain-containing protein